MRSFLPVDVEISELNDLNAVSSGKILCNWKAELQSTDTIVSLPQPILIRPEYFYRISIGHFPDEHVFYSKGLKQRVQLDTGVNVKLQTPNTASNENDIVVGLISTLNFNRL